MIHGGNLRFHLMNQIPSFFLRLLDLLAEADVGGYVATPDGQRDHPIGGLIHRLYVDSLQYQSADDVLMRFPERPPAHRLTTDQSGLRS